MKNHNSDITIQCPHSGVWFNPKRLNHLFHTPKDGSTFRNRLNRMKDHEMAASIRLNLDNLKIIAGLLPNLDDFNRAKKLDIEGFDWDVAKRILNPFSRGLSNTQSTYFYVYGFIIVKRISRIQIYDIKTSELILRPIQDSI